MLKKISSYPIEKLILWNAFARNFAACFATIYVSTLFIIEIGDKNWPSIFLYVQIFSLVFILLTNFIKTRQYYTFHKLMIGMGLVALALFTSNPLSKPFITALAVMTFVIELIGEITGTHIITKTMSALAYKANSPLFVNYTTSALILASLTVIMVQKFGTVYIFTAILLLFLTAHFVLFSAMAKKSIATFKVSKRRAPRDGVIERVTSLMKHAWTSPLIRLIFALNIWLQVAKFFNEWLYITSSSTLFTSKVELSIFLSVANISLMLCMLVFQRTLAKKITQHYTPAILIAIIPILFLVLSSIGTIQHTAYVGIVLNFCFIIVLKSLHHPTLQICLHSLEPSLKSKILMLLNFLASATLIFITSGLGVLRAHLSVDVIYAALCSLGVLGLFLVLKFEGPYFQNLWKTLNFARYVNTDPQNEVTDEKELFFNPQDFLVKKASGPMQSEVLDYLYILKHYPKDNSAQVFSDCLTGKNTTSFEKSMLIINALVYSKNKEVIDTAVVALKNLETPETDASVLVHRVLEIRRPHMDAIHQVRSVAHSRIKIFSLMNENVLGSEDQILVNSILASHFSPQLVVLSLCLSNHAIGEHKLELLRCWDFKLHKLDMFKLVSRYLGLNEKQRLSMWPIFYMQLPSPEESHQARDSIRNFVSAANGKLSKDEILGLLFIREWVGLKDKKMLYVLRTIQDYHGLSDEDKRYWKNFHLEYLKKIHSTKFTHLIETHL